MNQPSSTKRPTLRVLVVDDDVDTADSFGLLLRMWGYDAYVCYGPAEALDVVAAAAPHAVLLDIGLPEMDGYELARCLREQPGGDEMLLIAVTGYVSAADRRKAEMAGFDYHFAKPVEFAELHDLLRDLEASRNGGWRKSREGTGQQPLHQGLPASSGSGGANSDHISKEASMLSTMRELVSAALLPAMLTLLLTTNPAQAQNGACQGLQSGFNSQLTSTQLQALLQQQIAQLQTQLQQLQSGQTTLPANSQLTSAQVQMLLQQRISYLQARLQQLQTGQAASSQQTGQLTASQYQALVQQQAAQAVQLRALRTRR
jgi:CheY-like chemotaxis protein